MATYGPCGCGCGCDFGKKEPQVVPNAVKRPARPPKAVTLAKEAKK